MTHTPSSSISHPHSQEVSSKFREHLSVHIPSHDYPLESSRFSPESPPSTPPPVPHRAPSTWTTTATMRSSTPTRRGPEVPVPRTERQARGSRMARLFATVRALLGDREPELVPIQPAQPSAWPPLNVEKRACCHDCPCRSLASQKRRRRHRILTWILIVILIYLLGNAVVLNVRVFRPPANGVTVTDGRNSSVSTGSTSSGISTAAQECISQFALNAPSDPSGYPCSTCLSVLQSVPSSAVQNDTQSAQQIQNAIQFCALRSIFETAGSDGRTALQSGNWAQDVKFCVWSGVSCDGMGRVSSLSLTAPGVPALLPTELGALSGLESLTVLGDNASPAGPLPTSFTSWTSLSTLHLESTAMSGLPDNLFSSLDQVTTLTLVKNAKMGNTLPSSITGSSLQNLVVNGQTLGNPLPSLSASLSLQSSMKLLDLSSTTVAGTIPAVISSLSSLVELHLDFNNLSTPLPGSFPSSLQILSLSNNPQLAGPVSGSFCALGNLQKCSVQGTSLIAPAGGCGVCQFS